VRRRFRGGDRVQRDRQGDFQDGRCVSPRNLRGVLKTGGQQPSAACRSNSGPRHSCFRLRDLIGVLPSRDPPSGRSFDGDQRKNSLTRRPDRSRRVQMPRHPPPDVDQRKIGTEEFKRGDVPPKNTVFKERRMCMGVRGLNRIAPAPPHSSYIYKLSTVRKQCSERLHIVAVPRSIETVHQLGDGDTIGVDCGGI